MDSKMKPTRLVLILGLMTFGFASNTRAQTENRFALGAGFAVRMTDRASQEDYAQSTKGPALLWRVGHSKQGWGFHWGLNWYSVDISRPVGGSVTELGELHIRPLMAGYGYTQVIGRNAITASVIGGYAFGAIDMSQTAIDAYETRLGARSATADASNPIVLKPQISLWHDLTRKIGVNANFGYLYARPDVTVNTSIGAFKRQVRADQFMLNIGAVYSIF